jgi:perosamine synthetase
VPRVLAAVTDNEETIPLARPLLGGAEESAVLAVLRSGQLSLGPRVPEFERLFAERVGTPLASAVSSGTAGLHLALRAVGVEEGDEVVTSPFSFVASANVALYERARPVFADIDPVTLNLDPAAAAAAVSERTRALLPVHIFGYPADMVAFEALAARHGLAIVEDACEALGATHADGTPVGGRGHPAVFGFYANKQLTTGEGGMVTLADPALKQRIDSERNQGRAPDMGWLDHDRLGFNYRLSDIACALGIAQLRRLREMLAGRARVAASYRQALGELEGLELPCEDRGGNQRGWFVFVVQLPHGVDRDETVRALGRLGVQSKPYLPAIHLMSFYRERFGHREGEFPVCEDVAARSLALPFFPEMSEEQVANVAERLAQALRGGAQAKGSVTASAAASSAPTNGASTK